MSDTKRKKIFDFSLLKRVFYFAAPYKKRLYLSVALSVLLAVITPVRPYLIQLTVNNYIKNGITNDAILKNKMVEMIIWVTVIQIVLLLIETVFPVIYSIKR